MKRRGEGPGAGIKRIGSDQEPGERPRLLQLVRHIGGLSFRRNQVKKKRLWPGPGKVGYAVPKKVQDEMGDCVGGG